MPKDEFAWAAAHANGASLTEFARSLLLHLQFHLHLLLQLTSWPAAARRSKNSLQQLRGGPAAARRPENSVAQPQPTPNWHGLVTCPSHQNLVNSRQLALVLSLVNWQSAKFVTALAPAAAVNWLLAADLPLQLQLMPPRQGNCQLVAAAVAAAAVAAAAVKLEVLWAKLCSHCNWEMLVPMRKTRHQLTALPAEPEFCSD